MIASCDGFTEIVNILLKLNAKINIKDNSSRDTALHYASINGHLDIVLLLLQSGI